ncbi:MAG: DUF4268 domain-containing protein [Flavobacteriales bacterium]|jgi:hypothetical protein
MYSKEESRSLRREFWTSFGVYMKKYNKVYQGKINWVNYNTKCKDIYFRLDVTKKKASFSFDLQHRDTGMRELFYEQFTELKAVINDSFENELTWVSEFETEYGTSSRIYAELENVSVFNKNDWHDVFPFLEKNIVSAHEFWNEFSDIFTNLED